MLSIPSIIRQVELALLAVYKPGRKKHLLTPEVRERVIVSGRTLELYIAHGCTWARWCREHFGLRRLVDSNLMGQPWVQHLIDGERSAWTISAAISALRKLEHGVNARWGRELTLVVPEALAGRTKRLLQSRRRRGRYWPVEIARIRQHLTLPYDRALDAMLALGLRRHEVISIQAGQVDLEAVHYRVKGRDGTWQDQALPPGYRGVVWVRRGKGGRSREVPVPGWYREELRVIAQVAPNAQARLWPVQARELHRAFWRACRAAGVPSRGVHGLRHTWARQNYDFLIALGHSDEQARQMVSWWLGHNRLGVTVAYVPRDSAGADPTEQTKKKGDHHGRVGAT